MSALAPAFPLAGAAIAPLRAKAESLGRGDFSPLWSGQNASGCKEIPAADLTRELAAGLSRSSAAFEARWPPKLLAWRSRTLR